MIPNKNKLKSVPEINSFGFVNSLLNYNCIIFLLLKLFKSFDAKNVTSQHEEGYHIHVTARHIEEDGWKKEKTQNLCEIFNG